MAATPLLATKLQPPLLSERLLDRPHLRRKLDSAWQKPLTLVTAPAGYGKTCAVAAWLQQQETPYAWLSLDEADNEPARFLAYLIAALQRMDLAGADRLGRQTQALLPNPQPVTAVSLITPLLNDMAQAAAPFLLALDDYHLIRTPQIHEYINLMLAHPPAPLHLVLITREAPSLPLARLRAQQWLAEIGQADLLFSPAEGEAFLRQNMGEDTVVDTAVIHQLYQRTEGWIAGLQLAALSLRQREDMAKFLVGFSGSHHHLFDYLAAEVWQRVSPPHKSFLLATAILEELCASLCTAVLETTETAEISQATLETLHRAGFFLTPMDERREWFRYHPLFQEFLQTRLLRQMASHQLAALHRRAAEWYTAQNLMPAAIRHALAAGTFTQAADMIEQVSETAWLQGNFATLRYWFSHLPADLIAGRASLALYYAWVLHFDGRYQQCHQWLQRAGNAIEQAPDDRQTELHALVTIFSSLLSPRLPAPPASMPARMEQALHRILPEHTHWRALAYVALSYSAGEVGDTAVAQHALYRAQAESQRVYGDYLALLVDHNLVTLQLTQGQFQRAEQSCLRLLRRAEESDLRIFMAAVAHNFLGQIYLEGNRLQAADHHFTLAYQFGVQLDRTASQINALVGRLWLHKLLGDSKQVLAILDQIETVRREYIKNDPSVDSRHPGREAYRTLAAMERKQWPAVEQWLTAVPSPQAGAGQRLVYMQRTEYLIWSHIQLARGKPGAEAAIPVLEQWQRHLRSRGQPRLMVELLALLAGARFLHDDLEAALATLQEALALAAGEAFLFSFLIVGAPMRALMQEAERRGLRLPQVRALLRAFKLNDTLAAVPPDDSLLSEREREVLTLVAQGLSNRQTAHRLHISINTVKAHLKRVNVKLDVPNRTAAVTRARELGLI